MTGSWSTLIFVAVALALGQAAPTAQDNSASQQTRTGFDPTIDILRGGFNDEKAKSAIVTPQKPIGRPGYRNLIRYLGNSGIGGANAQLLQSASEDYSRLLNQILNTDFGEANTEGLNSGDIWRIVGTVANGLANNGQADAEGFSPDVLRILGTVANGLANNGQANAERFHIRSRDVFRVLGTVANGLANNGQANAQGLGSQDYWRIAGMLANGVADSLGNNKADAESLHTGDYIRLAGTLGSIFG